MAPPVFTLKDTHLRLGATPLFTGLDLVVGADDRLCLVGRNGSGKSTLMKVIAGLLDPDRGERFVKPATHVAYLPQDPDFGPFRSVSDYVAEGLPSNARNDLHRVEATLLELGLEAGMDPHLLSGGEARKAAIARALVAEPDILLADEPTNHLDLATIEWLESRLANFPGAIILISHDRAFLKAVSRATIWLDRGKLRRLDKGFAHFDSWRDQVWADEEAAANRLQKKLDEELHWLARGVTARRRRNQGRLRRLGELRREKSEAIKREGGAKIQAAAGAISGKIVIDAESISKSYGDRTLFSGFSTRIGRGDRVGLVGPNGAGKSTLLKILTGTLAPDEGSVRLGSNLTLAYLDQGRVALRETETVWDALADGNDFVTVLGHQRHVASYARDFLFAPNQLRAPVASLSGGERNRLLLARILARPSNLLVLDEPTNDLDMDTLDLLEDMLSDYEGTLLLVSHDRDFLDRIVTSTIVLEGDGTVEEYAGGYSDYRSQRRASIPAAATTAKPRGDASPARAGTGATRLSYKFKRRLELLPDEIAATEAAIADLETTLSDPGLYARDPARFTSLGEKLAATRARLKELEDEWLDLEMQREAAGGP